jgi:MoaA/NifB/PqqE/SkfB family radical SAM enzyme
MVIRVRDSYEILVVGDSQCSVDYHVTLAIGHMCNLKCDYCKWCGGVNYDKPIETVDSMYEFFIKMGYTKVLFYIHGGEPAIHPKILDTLKHIRHKQQETGINTVIEVQTNLSYSIDRLRGIVECVDRLSISYHYVELQKTNTHEHFISNFNWLRDNNIGIERFDIMMEDMPDECLSDFYDNVLSLLEYNGIVDSEMVYGFCHYDKNLSTRDKHIEFYNNHNKTEQKYRIDGQVYTTNELFGEGLDCRGCRCEAGMDDIQMTADGNVFSCASAMTCYINNEGSEKPLVNVLTDSNYITILSIKSKIGTKCEYGICSGDFYFERNIE